MKLRFLGTGTSTGVPHLTCNCEVCTSADQKDARLRSSALITKDGKNILIDCGPDFRQQALLYKIDHIDGILITHEHYDHVSGIDELRPYREADIYAEERVLGALRHNMPYVFNAQPYPGAPDIRLHEITKDLQTVDVAGIEVQPVRLTHFRLPILGYRIDALAYLTDFNQITDEECEKLKDLDVLIIDALRQQSHHAHYKLSEALAFVERIKPKKAYFMHMSHDMGLHEKVQAALPENVFLAYDGLEIEI